MGLPPPLAEQTPVPMPEFGEDGFCVEGISYWNYGFGHYILGTEAIRLATNNQMDIIATDPKLRRIAEFGLRWEIAGGVYPAFGDVAITRQPFPWMLDFCALKFGLGTPSGKASMEAPHPLGPHIYRILFDLAIPRQEAETSAGETDWQASSLAVRDWFPSGDALISRGIPATEGLAVAMLGDNNGRPHNHNDIGTFMVIKNGARVLSDLGTDDYVGSGGKMRSRYQSGVNNSFGHPVPRVAGKLQSAGTDARAETVRQEFTDERDLWEIDMTSAYIRSVPDLQRITRTFIFTRANGGRLEVIDHAVFKTPNTFGSALVLAPGQKRVPEGENAMRVQRGKESVRVSWEAEADGKSVTLKTPRNPIFGVIPDRPSKGTRLGFDIPEPASEVTIRLIITP